MIENVFTLGQVLKWASAISGEGLQSSRETLIDLVRESLDALFDIESVENLRKWCVQVCGCVVTLPYEIGEPQKYKIGNEIQQVRNKAWEFIGVVHTNDCSGYRSDLRYQGESPTYFDLPTRGARLAVKAKDYFEPAKRECDNPYLLVQGKDKKGKQVFTAHGGKMDIGERIYIAQPDENPRCSETIFSEIESVRIVNAHLHLTLVWCNLAEGEEYPYEYGILSEYGPGEEFPGYKRYEIPGLARDKCCRNIEILGQARKPALRYDNELIRGFDSLAIRSMISANWYRGKNDINGATFNSNIAVSSTKRKNEQQAPNTDNIPVFLPTCAAKFPGVY